jgi:hypothetical protein
MNFTTPWESRAVRPRRARRRCSDSRRRNGFLHRSAPPCARRAADNTCRTRKFRYGQAGLRRSVPDSWRLRIERHPTCSSETQPLPTQLIKPAAFRSTSLHTQAARYRARSRLPCRRCRHRRTRSAAFATAAAWSSRSRIPLIKDLIATSAMCSSMFKSSLPPKAVHYRYSAR